MKSSNAGPTLLLNPAIQQQRRDIVAAEPGPGRAAGRGLPQESRASCRAGPKTTPTPLVARTNTQVTTLIQIR